MENISNTYVINLKHENKRLNNFQKECERCFINYNRIEGVYGKNVTPEQRKKELTTFCDYSCTDSLIGCALSHKKAWKTALSNNDEYSMICEDDCYFHKDFNVLFPIIWNNVPKDFDILYVGCEMGCSYEKKYSWTTKLMMLFREKKYKKINKYVYIPELPLAAHCYILSKNGISKLLKSMEKINYHVDAQILTIEDLISYSINPKLAFQDVSLYTTSNVPIKYPGLLNKIAEDVKDMDNRPYSYNFSIPIISIYGVHLTGWFINIMTLGFIASFLGITLKQISYIFALYTVFEVISFPEHLLYSVEGYLFLFSGFYLGLKVKEKMK